jgi:hypothetical protein
MEESRLTLLADETLRSILPALMARHSSVARSITPQNFGSILDGTMRQSFQNALEMAGASEGSLWLVDQASESLVIAYNSGPNSGKLVAKFKQPLRSGLISMVFFSEQPFIENKIFRNSLQDRTLDSMLKVRTYAMIAVPFYFLHQCRGVASCVQLIPDANTQANGFRPAHEASFRNAIVTIGRLIDYWVICQTIGLE